MSAPNSGLPIDEFLPSLLTTFALMAIGSGVACLCGCGPVFPPGDDEDDDTTEEETPTATVPHSPTPSATVSPPPSASPTTPNPETDCDNGMDDDGDGDPDCDDSDCAQAANCIGEDCNNFLDDDGDWEWDCYDPDCATDPTCIDGVCLQGQPVHNGDFESGLDGSWLETSSSGFPIVTNRTATPNLRVNGGQWGAWLGGADNETSVLQQEFVPQVDAGQLCFDYQIATQDVSTQPTDTFSFEFWALGQMYTSFHTWSNLDARVGWVSYCTSIDGFAAGLPISIYLHGSTNGSGPTSMWIDNVHANCF